MRQGGQGLPRRSRPCTASEWGGEARDETKSDCQRDTRLQTKTTLRWRQAVQRCLALQFNRGFS